MKAFYLRASLLVAALALTTNAVAQSDLENAAANVSDQARTLEFSTRDYIDGRVSKSEVERQLSQLESLTTTYRRVLANTGGGTDISQCTQALSNQGFPRDDAASLCARARPYHNQLGACIQSFRNQGFPRDDAATHCLNSGAYSGDVAACTQSLRDQGFPRDDAASACASAQRFARVFSSCVQSLRNQGFPRDDAASYCQRAGQDSGFPTCVQNLRNQGFPRDQAASNCL